MKESALQWLDSIAGCFFPNVCQFCHDERAAREQGYIGSKCWGRLRFLRSPFCQCCGLPFEGALSSTFRCPHCQTGSFAFSGARAALVANEFSLGLIHRYKYHRNEWLEVVLAEFLWNQLQWLGMQSGWDAVVPVPLFSSKQREREFNQAERMGRFLSRRMGAPLAGHVLKRVAPTLSQTMLSRSERRRNVHQAFAPATSEGLTGKRVMLVDDVFTTGATSNACARVLRRMGASEVWGCTVVRGL